MAEAARRIPRLVEGTELIGEYQGSGFQEPIFIVRRVDGQVIQLPRLLYLLAAGLDGKRDLEQHMLRHVSEAFAEDPVRILRVARFAARFGFDVAPETMALMKHMVASGEADYPGPERVWQEFAKGLMEREPERMFEVLEATDLQKKLLPELRERVGISAGSLPVRFARLARPLKEPEVEALCERLKVPSDVKELALLACRTRVALRASRLGTPAALLELLKRADAFRRPERFEQLLEVAHRDEPIVDTARLERARRAPAGTDPGTAGEDVHRRRSARRGRDDRHRLRAVLHVRESVPGRRYRSVRATNRGRRA